jgi:hypothetical protein
MGLPLESHFIIVLIKGMFPETRYGPFFRIRILELPFVLGVIFSIDSNSAQLLVKQSAVDRSKEPYPLVKFFVN